jgi:hypothetical protein
MSHCWPVLPSQGAIWTGFRFARKSPERRSTKRHCPSEVCGGQQSPSIWAGLSYLDRGRRESFRSSGVDGMSFIKCRLVYFGDCSNLNMLKGRSEREGAEAEKDRK